MGRQKIIQKIYVSQKALSALGNVDNDGNGGGGNNHTQIQVIGAVNGNNGIHSLSSIKGVLDWCSDLRLHGLILKEIMDASPESRLHNLIMKAMQAARDEHKTDRGAAEYLGINRGTVYRTLDKGGVCLGGERPRRDAIAGGNGIVELETAGATENQR